MKTFIASAEKLGVDFTELFYEPVVAGSKLIDDTENNLTDRLSRDIPHLADEETGQSEKSQEGLPSASVSKSCMERSSRVCLKIQTGYLD